MNDFVLVADQLDPGHFDHGRTLRASRRGPLR
jgi:hypothetical protein